MTQLPEDLAIMAGLSISESIDSPTGPATVSEKGTVSSTSRKIPHLLLAYPESTTEDVIRPCLVTSKNGSTPFLQWFGFSRNNEGLFQLYPYTETRTYDFELPEPESSSANLSSGIPFLRNEADGDFTVDLDPLENEDPTNYATYELVTDTYDYDALYIIRLMSSVSLWRRVAERLWERANKSDAISVFDTFRLLRKSFLQKTDNEGAVELKIDHISVAALKTLRDGGLLDGVLEEICLVDEQSRKDSIRTTEAVTQVETWHLENSANEMLDNRLMEQEPSCIDGELNREPQLARWIHYCKDLRAAGSVGIEVEARCDYRWFYEDWPRPRSIFPGNPMHWEDDPSLADQLSSLEVPPPLSIADDNTIGEEFWKQFPPMRNDRGSREMRQDLENAIETRICIEYKQRGKISMAKKKKVYRIEGTVMAVKASWVAVKTLDSPDKVYAIPLNWIVRWEIREWWDRSDYPETEGTDGDGGDDSKWHVGTPSPDNPYPQVWSKLAVPDDGPS